jgi:hypothetical protein
MATVQKKDGKQDEKKVKTAVRKSKNWKVNYRRMQMNDELPAWSKLGIVGDVKFKWSDEP